MDQQYPTVAKIPMLDTRKFEQWQFQMQQYHQHEHYALWEVVEFLDSYTVPEDSPNTTVKMDADIQGRMVDVTVAKEVNAAEPTVFDDEEVTMTMVIEFGDSYKVPANAASTATIDTTNDETGKQKGRTVTVTADDMQKRKNDVKARTTLLLSLPDEHQLRFSKYKTTQESWAAILKTFGGNEATKKTKKNLLKQQYGNFKAEGIETLEQTFNRLQVIISQLQFMNVEIEQDDLNQKFLTSLAPEWLMHTIVWRNKSELDTMSLDDLYNHLKIDEDDMDEMDIKWNMALLSMRADKFWKMTGKKISIQGTDVAGFDKLKVECFNCHKMGHFARKCRAPRIQDRGRRDNYIQGFKFEEQAPKALMVIDGVGWNWSYMANDEENHALVTEKEAPIE
nr:hypothetical protein [Tanacetum cinerariifolium]